MRPISAIELALTGDTLDLRLIETGGAPVFVDLDIATAGALTPDAAPGQIGLLRIGDQEEEIIDVENIIGGDAGERLFGGEEDGVILAGGGDDVVHPFNGTDFVDGGDGVDTLLLNALDGPVTAHLGRGFANTPSQVNTILNFENITGSNLFSDRLTGDRGDNVISGGAGGDDTLRGGRGDDTLAGGDGDDRLLGGRNDDVLNGDAGDDRLVGGRGDDWLTGGEGADRFVIRGRDGDDLLTDLSFEEGDVLLFAGLGRVRTEEQLENLALRLNARDPGAVEVEGDALILSAARASVTIEGADDLVDLGLFI